MLKKRDTDEWFSKETQPTQTLTSHTNSIECLKFNPSNYLNIFSGSHDRTIKSWDLNFGECKETLSGHKEGVWCLDVNKSGTLLASGSPDQSVIVWDLKTKKPLQNLKIHSGKVVGLEFNETENLLASCGYHNSIIVWDVKTFKPVKMIKTESSINYSVSFSKDGKYLCCGDFDGAVSIYDGKTFELICSSGKSETENRIFAVASNFNYVNNKIYAACEDSVMRIFTFDPATKTIKASFEKQNHLDSIRGIFLDKELYLTSSKDGSCRAWKTDNNDFYMNFLGHIDLVSSCGIYKGKNDIMVATGSYDQSINIYKLK